MSQGNDGRAAGGEPLPERIGPYRIKGRLGAGGMGEVFRGWDERLRRPVAIKRVRLGTASAERRERFRREARAAARLSHPAIVQVHELIRGDEWDALVMELVEGRPLAELAAEGLPVAQALDLACQVADGLAEAHAKGLVHRDLKAENVMVAAGGRWGRAKILDFGLAKALETEGEEPTLTEVGALLGTSRAMAPEQVEGQPVDARTDLFSLGVLLYEMVAGRSPFRGATAVQTLKNVLTEEPPPLDALRPELPAALGDLVARLLGKDPAQRPDRAPEVVERLEELAARPETAELGPPPARGALAAGWSEAPTGEVRPPVRPAPPARSGHTYSLAGLRGRTVLGAAAALLGLALVAAAVWLSHSPSTETLTVAVLEPDGETAIASAGADEGGETPTSTALLLAVLDGLAALRSVEPLDPSLLRASGVDAADPRAAARALGADEVLLTSFECRPGDWCRVAFRRLAGDTGGVIGATAPFEVSARSEDALELAGAVRVHLHRHLYPGHSPRDGAGLEVRSEDYVTFLGLRHRAEAGEALGEEGLRRLAALLESSPRFVDGYLWAADQARVLRRWDQALAWLDRAAALFPSDPRPSARRLLVLLEAGRTREAEQALRRLEKVAPGSIRAAAGRARWLERQDRHAEAVAAWKQVVERRRSWRNLGRLARAEMNAGNPAAARRRLEELLELSPSNVYGLSLLAFLEARHGALERAATLERRLLEVEPNRRHWSNLAWIQYLRGDYDAARASSRRALELEPGHPLTRLNLALIESAAGDSVSAQGRCRKLLDDLPPAPERSAGPPPSPHRPMIRAVCLARLGEATAAVRAVERALALEHRPSAQLRHRAAEVFSLLGDRASALHQLEEALAQGLSRQWLREPAFDSLRQDPRFQALTESPQR